MRRSRTTLSCAIGLVNCGDDDLEDLAVLALAQWPAVLDGSPGSVRGQPGDERQGSRMTDEPGVPAAVRDFVLEQIFSIEQLEVLLLLRRNAGTGTTPLEVSRELKTSSFSAERRLADLRERGLARSIESAADPTFVYSPQSPLLAGLVNALAVAYAERPHSIIRLIFSKPRPA